MSSDSDKTQKILAEHLCSSFSGEAREEKKLKTAANILTERVCLRLADFARELADDTDVSTPEIRAAMRKLKPESFSVLYDLINHDQADAALSLIEDVVNHNTSDFVKEAYGNFSFYGTTAEMFDDEAFVAYLITFDPDNCVDSKERYAAIRVVQRFESMLLNNSDRRPIGNYGHNYGAVQVLDFYCFAYLVNGVLEKYALPEQDGWVQVSFDEALEEANGEILRNRKDLKPPQP